MNIYFILLVTIIVSITLFGILVKLLNYLPRKYHKSIQLVGSLGIIVVIIL